MSNIQQRLSQAALSLQPVAFEPVFGKLVRVSGLILEVVGCSLQIGQRCYIETKDKKEIPAEVIGFHRDTSYLMPLRHVSGLHAGATVRPCMKPSGILVNSDMTGRIFDGLMTPLDDLDPIKGESIELDSPPLNPIKRKPVREPLDVGIKAINSLLTPGKGQRLGLFASAGLGKSVLMGMITRYTSASIIIVGLIGERGREVREFIEEALGEEGLKRSIVIAAPADQSPLMRVRAAETCHRLAEHYRDKGEDVLLLMDSFTRYAHACREIALSLGEPPATKGYPPSVFASLTRLAERSGNSGSEGSMTAIYTVLSEGDDFNDPIADAAKAILDGHIMLSRDLAEKGQYPAIDVNASISRVMSQVVSKEHMEKARYIKSLLSKYNAIQELIPLGGYKKGEDPDTDKAVQSHKAIFEFLRQDINEPSSLDESINLLVELANA